MAKGLLNRAIVMSGGIIWQMSVESNYLHLNCETVNASVMVSCWNEIQTDDTESIIPIASSMNCTFCNWKFHNSGISIKLCKKNTA